MAGPRHCPPRTRTISEMSEDDSSSGPSSIDSGVSESSYISSGNEESREPREPRESSWPLAKHWFVKQVDLGVDLETIIRPYLPYLCKNTQNVRKMMEIWYAKHDYTLEQCSHVLRHNTTYSICCSLYAAAMTQNDGKKLLEAWTQSDNHHIVQYLKNQNVSTFNPPTRQVSATESVVSMTTVATQCDSDDKKCLVSPPAPTERDLLMEEKMAAVKSKKQPQPRWKLFYFCVCLAILLFFSVGSVLFLLNSFQIKMPQSEAKCQWPTMTVGSVVGEEKNGDPNKIEENRKEIFISIDSPMTKLPSSHSTHMTALHLTIVSRKRNDEETNDAFGAQTWLGLHLPPDMAGGVMSLTLVGHFGDPELDHFCRLFPNVSSIYELPLHDGDGHGNEDEWDY